MRDWCTLKMVRRPQLVAITKSIAASLRVKRRNIVENVQENIALRKEFPTDAQTTLHWPPLVAGTLVRRYQRFISEVRLDDGGVVKAHCPNSGSMLGCSEPGRVVYVSRAQNSNRKLPYTWELIRMPGSLVGINTLVPNRLVHASVAAAAIPELVGYDTITREVATGPGARLDLRLESPQHPACFVEVKNCTLVENGAAYFPDAATARGVKHLGELERLAAQGCRAVIFFVVQRMDAKVFRPADAIDPEYGHRLREAVKKHVEILAYDVHISLTGISLRKRLPCQL